MGRLRILLAEDHREVAEQLRSLLAEHYDVQVVCDGGSLVRLVRQERPDAIVTDITMPDMSGLAAARTALELYPSLPVVLVTVMDAPEVIRSALAMGVRGYVLKCDAGEELTHAVRVGLSGQTYLSTHARPARIGP